MSKLKDYNCCPHCGGKLIDRGNHDCCETCGWKKKVAESLGLSDVLLSIQPGEIFEGRSGRYERTYDGEWMCVLTRIIYSDSELYVEESRA